MSRVHYLYIHTTPQHVKCTYLTSQKCKSLERNETGEVARSISYFQFIFPIPVILSYFALPLNYSGH